MRFFEPGGLPWILDILRFPLDFHSLGVCMFTYLTAPGDARQKLKN